MSQADPSNASTTRCEVCYERSTWSFLRDFYFRAESANEYARKLESDLCDTAAALHQCEASLVTSWESLNAERLEHRATKEELALERHMHEETAEMLQRVFDEALRTGEIADNLSNQITALQAASNFGVNPVILQTEDSPRRESSIASTPTNQMTHSSTTDLWDTSEREDSPPVDDMQLQSSASGVRESISTREGSGSRKRSKPTPAKERVAKLPMIREDS